MGGILRLGGYITHMIHTTTHTCSDGQLTCTHQGTIDPIVYRVNIVQFITSSLTGLSYSVNTLGGGICAAFNIRISIPPKRFTVSLTINLCNGMIIWLLCRGVSLCVFFIANICFDHKHIL